ncbi:MAG: hypothetical protein M0P71_16220 [Melioribacteraceae bacterium]|jgi:hypothetical protein|nr:hypothetical protein [Melioribacteraceae bacterium]
MKLLHGVPGANGALSFALPKGQYGIIQLHFAGTAAAGVTVTRLNLGSVRLSWNGQDIVNVDAEILNLLNNTYGGVATFASAIGAAFTCDVMIPCGQWIDSSNIYDVGNSDQVILTLQFPDLANVAIVAAATVDVYAKEKIGVMNYLFHMIQRNVISAGAGIVADTYPMNNITQVYLKDPATANVTRIQILKDNTTIVSAPTAVVQAHSDWTHLNETATTTTAIEFIESKDVREAVGAQISYNYTFSGAGTLSQYFAYVTFTEQKAIESRNKSAQKLGNNISIAAKVQS